MTRIADRGSRMRLRGMIVPIADRLIKFDFGTPTDGKLTRDQYIYIN